MREMTGHGIPGTSQREFSLQKDGQKAEFERECNNQAENSRGLSLLRKVVLLRNLQ